MHEARGDLAARVTKGTNGDLGKPGKSSDLAFFFWHRCCSLLLGGDTSIVFDSYTRITPC